MQKDLNNFIPKATSFYKKKRAYEIRKKREGGLLYKKKEKNKLFVFNIYFLRFYKNSLTSPLKITCFLYHVNTVFSNFSP